MEPITAADFDASSAAWMANKIRKGPALAYKCIATTKAGKPCSNAAKSNPLGPHLCGLHGSSSRRLGLVTVTMENL